MSPALKQQTVFVFDWDDTILPTSWLERIHALNGGRPLRPEVQRQMVSLCTVALQTLTLAGTMGVVVIITNSAPGWVDQSCQLFMPQLLQQVRGYHICAKPMHAPLTFKTSTFRRECRSYGNLISVGDGDAERAASLKLHDPPPGGQAQQVPRHVKSLKLLEVPTCQQLVAQHELLQTRLGDVATFQGNLDLKVRFAMTGMASAPGAKGGSCTLVHFPRPYGLGPPQGFVPNRASLPAGVIRNGANGSLPPLSRASYSGPSGATEGGDAGQLDRAAGDRATSSSPVNNCAASPPHAEMGDHPRGPGRHGPFAGDSDRDAIRINNCAGREQGGTTPSQLHGSPQGGGASIWRLQGPSDGRSSRQLYQAPGKKRPGGVPGMMSARASGAVWRDSSVPTAVAGF